MRHLKKFESYETSLKDEILEYFIDMDKNHGGNWDVDVNCIPPNGNYEYYTIRIVSRSRIDLSEFLGDFSSRVKMVESMGDFKLYPPSANSISDIFGFYSLNIEPIDGRIPDGIPSRPNISIKRDTLDNIDIIRKRVYKYKYGSKKRVYTNPKDRENFRINLNMISIYFIPNN